MRGLGVGLGVRLGILLGVLLGTATVDAQDRDTGIVITHHAITVGGQRIAYTARAGLIPIRINETGEAHGYVFFVAYTVDRASSAPPRPITFLWHGGPGANSQLMHLVAFGPRRIAARDAAHPDRLVIEDNAATLLGATDLVFVDPVGTGYGRLARADHAPEFYGTLGDIAVTTEFIRVYLTRRDGWRRPLFVGGESFGVWRAAGVAEMLERKGIPVAGEILISGGMPVVAKTPYALKAALFLPTRTAAALFHGKLASDLQADPRAAFAASAQWARAEYAGALDSAEHLSPERKAAVAMHLARFTGLDVSLIDTATLIVKRGQFGQQLLRDQHVTLDRFDDRRTHPAGAEMGRSKVDIARDALTVRYLRLELGYRTDLAYLGSEAGYVPVTDSAPSSPDQQWAWDQNAPPKDSTAPPPAASAQARRLADDGPPNGAEPWLLRAMGLDPSLHAFVAVGLYDSLNSCAWNDYLAGWLEPAVGGRIVAKCYVGGHMMYEDPDTRYQLTHDVAAFIRSTAASSPAR